METKHEFFQTRGRESMRFPLIRRGIIVVSLIIFVIWLTVISFYAYQDSNVLCFSNHNINILTYLMSLSSVVGILVYFGSPDSQLKILSWIRRVPMFWDSIMDSGYTPYFDPDYFEIKNGHYMRSKNNAYKVDNIGLPIVSAITPLNSFNMGIYRKYYKSVIDSAKSWSINSRDPSDEILRKYLIERTQIVLVGATCMIVKARSGEHLLIHNSKYDYFIQDQIKTTRRTDLDSQRAADLALQQRYIDGLDYFTRKLDDRFALPPVGYKADTPLYNHYDQLLKEMNHLTECNKNVIPSLQLVLKEMLYSSTIPQSAKSIQSKCLDLNIAAVVKDTIESTVIQRDILDQLNPLTYINKTEIVMDRIFKLTSFKYTSALDIDLRIIKSKETLGRFIDDHSLLESTLDNKSSGVCKFDVMVSILPKYDTQKLLAPLIAANNTGYKNSHGIGYALNTIKSVGIANRINANQIFTTLLKSKNSLSLALLQNVNKVKEHAKIELAKSKNIANMINKYLTTKTAEIDGLNKVLQINPSRSDVQLSAKSTEAEINTAKSIASAEKSVKLDMLHILEKSEKINDDVKRTEAHKSGLENRIMSDLVDLERREQESQKIIKQLDIFKSNLNQANAEKAQLSSKLNQLNATIIQNNNQSVEIGQQQQTQIELIKKEILRISQTLIAKDSDIAMMTKKNLTLISENAANRNAIETLEDQLQRQTDELQKINIRHTQDALNLAEIVKEIAAHKTDRQQLINDHKVMIETIKHDGDAKLKAIVAEKQNEIATIDSDLKRTSEELLLADQAKISYEIQLKSQNDKIVEQQQNLAVVSTAAINAARKVAARNVVSFAVLSAVGNTTEKRLKEEKQSQFTEFNNKLIEANNTVANLSHVLENNATKLEELSVNKRISDSAIAALSQKAKITEQEKQELSQRLIEADKLKFELERTKQSNEQLKTNLEQLKIDKDQYEQTLATNTESMYRNELAELARLKDQETEIELKLKTLASQKLNIESLADQMTSERDLLQRENTNLIKKSKEASTRYKKKIQDLIDNNDQNFKIVNELCASAAKKIEKYKTGIKIQIKHNNLPIKVNDITIDLTLIEKLNDQMESYLKNNGIQSSTLMKSILPKFYTSLSGNGPTLLKEDKGKLFAYVYSMYKIILMHEGINTAIDNIERCALENPEQYQILNECNIFKQNGDELFNHIDNITRALDSQKINYFTNDLVKIKASNNSGDSNAQSYNYIMSELYKFSFQKNNPNDTQINPSQTSNKIATNSPPIPKRPTPKLTQNAFTESLPSITYETQSKIRPEQSTTIDYDTGYGTEATITIPPMTKLRTNANDVELDDLIKDIY